MTLRTTLLNLAITASLIPFSSYAIEKNEADLTAQYQKIIDNYYDKYSQLEQFTAISASILVPENNKINPDNIKTLVKGTIGLAPLTQLITADSLFEIGSITKSYTSVILLQLQAEGKLNLNDTVGKWLPQYKNWSEVSLRQLLNMTSGIPNYSEDPEFTKKLMGEMNRIWTNEELLSYAHPEKPIKMNQNNLYKYCNSNYILAALVIEKITQDIYANQLQKRILGQQDYFNHSFYPAGPNSAAIEKELFNQRVHGYFYNEPTKKSVDTSTYNLTWAGAAGAIVANTNDVARWVQWLYHGTLINPPQRAQSLAELMSVVSRNTGKPIKTISEQNPGGYGLGVGYLYDAPSSQRFWYYKGSTLGFRVAYIWSACNDVTVVVGLNSKAGEGDPTSPMGDHINEALFNLYKAIIEHNPQLACINK